MTPEGKVKQEVKALLHARDVWWFMPRGTAFGKAGVPDFVACCNGFFIGIECKAGKNTLTALQLKEKAGIKRQRGFYQVVTDNPDTLVDLAQLIESIQRIQNLM